MESYFNKFTRTGHLEKINLPGAYFENVSSKITGENV